MPRTITIEGHLAQLLERYRRQRVVTNAAVERLRAEDYGTDAREHFEAANKELATLESLIAFAIDIMEAA